MYQIRSKKISGFQTYNDQHTKIYAIDMIKQNGPEVKKCYKRF